MVFLRPLNVIGKTNLKDLPPECDFSVLSLNIDLIDLFFFKVSVFFFPPFYCAFLAGYCCVVFWAIASPFIKNKPFS